MVNGRDGLSWQDWKELCDAAHVRFQDGEINETEYRKLLSKLGFNAYEIDQEVSMRSGGI